MLKVIDENMACKNDNVTNTKINIEANLMNLKWLNSTEYSRKSYSLFI